MAASLLEMTAPALNINWGRTYTKKYEVTFKWVLNNFSFLPHNVTHESPIFSGGPNDDIKWCLDLITMQTQTVGNEFFGIRLRLISMPQNTLKVLGKFKFSIIDVKCRKTNELNFSELCEFQPSGNANAVNLIKKKILYDEADVLLPKDTLTILCEIHSVTDKVKSTGRRRVAQFQDPGRKLADDFGNLLDNQKFSDITLVVGTHEFPVHKAILAARSDVFDAMFEHKMEENKSGRVTITDVEHEVLQELIRFIYTGDVPKIEEMADRLFAAADKYQLEELRAMCEEELLAKLSIETAVNILILADRHTADNLKEQTIQFINNHAIDIIKTNDWRDLIVNHSPLIAETFEALVTQHLKTI